MTHSLPFITNELALAPDAKLGRAMRAAREAKRLSVDDLSRITRIGRDFLYAIEEEQFEQFAAGVYATGFVRAYAREVGVPVEWALGALSRALDESQPSWRRSGWSA